MPCTAVWCGTCYTTHLLDKFYRFTPTDEEGFQWRPTTNQLRYLHARDGDYLLVPFQCDLCMFCNLTLRKPAADTSKDDLLLCCIHHINLDAVWGREAGTVNATLRSVQQMTRLMDKVYVCPDLPPRAPLPVADSFGAEVAIAMVLKSLDPG
jgi:hypothetical protein